MISLNTNVSALNSARLLNITNNSLTKTTERLSSTLRINRAADDPSGLFASESLTTVIRGNTAAIGNIDSALAVSEIGDQAYATLADTMQRMRELTVSASSGLLDADQRTAINAEYVALHASLQDTIDNATWGGTTVLGGTFDGATLQIGYTSTATALLDIDAAAATIPGQATIANQADALTAMGQLGTNLDTVNNSRAKIGAQMSGLLTIKNSLGVQIVASTEARSRVRDADIATEVSNLVRQQIQQQAGASALSAANFSAQFVLSLLQ